MGAAFLCLGAAFLFFSRLERAILGLKKLLK
jgi:hypothetical protein